MTRRPHDEGTIDGASRSALLAIARRALADRLAPGAKETVEAATPEMKHVRAVFVTLRHRGRLRGCIGLIAPVAPLAEGVARCAISAASDPRFPPLQPEELEETRIEISVLTPPRAIRSEEEIRVGRDGLMVSRGWRRGLLLPQVALEQGWDAGTFLEETCVKADLPRDAWRSGAKVEAFTAEVFGEGDPGPGEGAST